MLCQFPKALNFHQIPPACHSTNTSTSSIQFTRTGPSIRARQRARESIENGKLKKKRERNREGEGRGEGNGKAVVVVVIQICQKGNNIAYICYLNAPRTPPAWVYIAVFRCVLIHSTIIIRGEVLFRFP